GPDYRLHPADKRIEDCNHAQYDDYLREVPVRDAADCQRQQIEHKAHLRKMPRGKCKRRVEPNQISKALAEVLISAHRYNMTEKWHDDNADGRNHPDKHDSRNQHVPVAGISRPWIRDESHAGNNRGHEGHANGPPWYRTLCKKIFVRSILSTRSPYSYP